MTERGVRGKKGVRGRREMRGENRERQERGVRRERGGSEACLRGETEYRKGREREGRCVWKVERKNRRGIRSSLWLYILVLCLTFDPVTSQGHFPRLENIGAHKPVTLSPARSSCGTPERTTYCHSPTSLEELHNCSQAFCNQECPYRSSTPPHAPLLLPAHWDTCVTQDGLDPRSRAGTGGEGLREGDGSSRSVIFRWTQGGCVASPPFQSLGHLGSFTLAVWIKPEAPGDMTVLEKSSEERLVFLLTVSESAVKLQYGQPSGQAGTLTFSTQGRLTVDRWTHLALQVHGKSVSLFLDGLEEDGTPFDTRPLTSPISDIRTDSTMRVGLSSNGSDQFMGRMQDFRFYPNTLTNREIVKVYSGFLPPLHAQSECRCPPSHPRVHPLVERYCIPNAVEDTTNNRVLRLNMDAHPVSYINDQDMGTAWVSNILTGPEDMDQGLTITIDLVNGQYQVFYVILQLVSPQPEALHIQRRCSNSSSSSNSSSVETEWLDWQYMARDCSLFGLQNNGPLLRPDSVNCLQFPSDVPYSQGNITFSMLTPEPNLRPGYNDFYNTPALQQMVQATWVRIHLSGQYHTQNTGAPQRHRYYGVNEITISGRCECHGHADQCDTSVTPYRCACLPESHTEGHNCQRCAPLYNDKPFRSGDQVQAYSCRPCDCHGHALSCHYDITADAHPTEHYRGGGGVCDDCMHNTTGRSCESCVSQFYREVVADPRSEVVCRPCDCHTPGSINGSLECHPVGGQCKCKRRVSGRRCDACQVGFYSLQPWGPEGCLPCGCSAAGTRGDDGTCHQQSGQCQCKTHVIGLTCDRCDYGYKLLNSSHLDGCVGCDCDPVGSLSPFCEPEGGQCECREGVGGQRCDSCARGLYGLHHTGSCIPCLCSPDGTVPGTVCDPETGQCVCKENTEGPRCDSCRRGYHSLERRNSLGCLACTCDVRGTLEGGVCDPVNAQCPCREGVEGAQCTRCSLHYYNTTSDLYNDHTPEPYYNMTFDPQGSSQGCVPCVCDPTGTVEGTMCDADTGQCVCVSTRHGRDCGRCRPGYFLSVSELGSEMSVCVECDCHPVGSSGQVCGGQTGQCVCVDPSVGGRRCDQCQELHYGFNPGLGRCQACVCNSVGGVNGSCHPETGRCQCKALVTGDRCDRCVPGASHLDSDNHLGCSKAPIQQPSPVGLVLTSTSIRLTWRPPDAPNTHTLNYTLLRDGLDIYTTQRHYPFSPVTYVDSGLSPFVDYSYKLVTANVNGQTVSVPVSYQTLAAVPDPDHILLTLVGRPGPTTANLNWTRTQNTSGPQERFVLTSVEAGTGRERVHYTGLETQAAAAGLSPYTHYNLTLQACTTGGCTSTPPLPLLTSPSPPQGQPPPRVNATGPHQIHAAWDPPVRPNGVIIRYELFIRGPMESQNTTSPAPERRVFVSSGWLDPRLPSDSAKESALPPPQSGAMVTDLQPFSTYQLRVLTVNMAGSVISDWTTARTQEGAPEFVAPPEVSAVSSSSLKVAWRSARGQEARGQVTEYRVNLVTEQRSNPYAPPVVTQVLYVASPSERVYLAEGLEAYRRYDFTVTLCTSLGCVTSLPASGRTLPTAPAGLAPPRLRPVHGTLMEVTWDPPSQPHGPPPLYQVERTDLSLSDPRDLVVRGARFPGNGYHRFPSDTLPVNSDFTGLRLSFRTRASDGLLLCAVSPGNQEEYLALQIRNGRPYFLFDPQGWAVGVGVEGDGGRSYNDGQWHSVMATRKQAVGTIIVDDQYQGNASASSGSSIIGENTGVFIGGLPEDFTLLRQDSGDAQLVQQGFSGCLRDVQVKMIDSPSEVWQPLDWSRATERVVAYESWEGCPAHTEEGAHFLGQGFLELSPEVFSGGEDFDISFEFRTDQLNALLLFSYNTHTSDYILAELEGGMLLLVLSWRGHMTELSMWAGLSYCDGGWNQLSLVKQGDVISASMNDWSEQLRGAAGGELGVDSPLYLGGVPPELNHGALVSHSHRHGLGGCVRGVTVQSGPVTGSGGVPDVSAVSLSASTRRSVRINLDGCPATDSIFYCRGNDSVLVYMGRETQARDLGVQPFTEYLYRVVASGEGGWTTGPWERGRSRETVPQSVAPPSSLQSGSGFSVQVSWAPPLQVSGVIDRYELRAYDLDQPDSTPVTASYLSTGNHTGLLEGLTPFTRYVITVTACTWAGCTESPRDNSRDGDVSWSITTPEEVPEDVSPPSAVSTPSSLAVSWGPPARPNGLITDYLLYHNGQLLYQGNNTHLNITGLGVYSPHMFVLSVCTAVGCSNSSQVTLLTSQQPPGDMEPPSLTVLDSRTVYIQWSRPEQVNGVLEFYSVYLSVEGEEPVCVYNSSELFEDHTLRNLTPGTTYSFTVTACTGGGCSFSPPSEAHTEESTPENIPAPYVTPLSPHALNITWTPPDTPNGVISSYGVWMNGVLVQNSTSLWFSVDHLSPWSLHSFRVQACTAQGCALGPLVERRTLEMAPVGPVVLEVDSEGPTSLRAKWSQPAKPSGNITYTLLYTHTGPGHDDGDGEGDGDSVYNSSEAGRWVSVGGLQPYSNYSLMVRACNSMGCVDSLPTAVFMPPTAPDGVMPPGGLDATPASLQLSWLPPGRANAPGPLYYDLQMRATPDGPIRQLLNNVTSTFSHTVEGLSPYTDYLFRVVVSHTHGETASDWTSLRTAEDSPGPVDPPVVSSLQSHSVLVSWVPPAQPNGVITHYTLHLTSTLSLSHSTATVPGNTTSYSLYNLLPYQLYSLQVEACTPAGCTLSGESQSFHTPAAPPEGVPLPHLYSDTPTSVLLSWGAPERSNGELEGWVVERSVRGTQQISTVVRLPPSPPPLSYLDHSSALSPWTSYQYRLVASTQAGSNTSAWANITTRPSRPAGLVPPRVDVLGPDSLQVMWSPPVIANGVIDRYEIRLPDPRVSHDDLSNLIVTVTDLVPYTDYLVTVLACSSGGGLIGGCTESLPTAVTTLPTIPQDLAPLAVVAVSESFLAVSWQPPDRPNGPNLRYELLRRKSRQPLAAQAPADLHRWFNVYAGDKLFHQDKGLSRFTWYQYQLLVYNDVGYSTGQLATGVTLAGVPLHPPSLSVQTIDHTSIHISWTEPSLQDLQGEVELYTLRVESSHLRRTLTFPPGVDSTVIGDLQPNTHYRVSLQVSNGAYNTSNIEVNCTTEDGEPEGVFPPEVVPVNSSTVRVLWSPPVQPNGAVTEYSVYLDGTVHATADNTSGSYLLGGLLPFTVYDIKVEVCTVYGCVKSNATQVTTVEDLPADIAPPHIQVLSPRSVRVEWSSPGQPCGIMLGYEVWRKMLRPCGGAEWGSSVTQGGERSEVRCSYLQCSASQGVCGASCYQPQRQVCCDGVVYTSKPLHLCCEGRYLPSPNSSHTLCCGGKLLPPLPDHQCCGRYYIPVATGEVCCPDPGQGRVSVGVGDACCGRVPYSPSGGQLCCGGLLHDGYRSQCCGSTVIEDTLVCCGDAERGIPHTPLTGLSCCGEDYLNSSTSLCCVGHDGFPRMHPAGNGTVHLQCCGSEVINQEEECCNGVGYNPHRHVCADRVSSGLVKEAQCSPSTLCSVSAASTAYCGSCSFNPSLYICTWVLATHTLHTTHTPETTTLNSPRTTHTLMTSHTPLTTHTPLEQSDPGLCSSQEDLIYSGVANRYSYTDSDLEPYTTYEYRVSAWNSYGRGYSNVTVVTTNEDTPWGVAPPHWSRLGDRDDVVQLHWQAPAKPNGDISHYVVLRDGQERYRGDEMSFTDVGGIRPFQEYEYWLRACNSAGCTDSSQVLAVTVQGVPEEVGSPIVTALGPGSLRLSWAPPSKSNGIIRLYHINMTSTGTIHTHTPSDGPLNYTVTGLQPHSDYSFVLVACTAVGCGASQPSTGRTLQDAPTGVWSSPRHVVVNSTAVELYWDQPLQPNGHVASYRLLRDGVTVFAGDSQDNNYTDTQLQPNTRYVLVLEATTSGGSGLSNRYIVQTPVSSPLGVPPPHNVTVFGPRSLFVSWKPPGVFNTSLPLYYNILLNPGSARSVMRTVGQDQYLSVSGLDPYTQYHIRVQACQADGCGLGEGVYVRTSEAPPEDMDPPTVTAAGATVIQVCWNPPHKPNGLITSYFIHRRPMGTQEELLVFIWSNGPLEFIDASDALQPFRQYQYSVLAHNSRGSARSQWASAVTMEAGPEDIAPPIVTPTSAYSVQLNWTQPGQPNGRISQYRLVYRKQHTDPTLNTSTITALTVPGSALQSSVYGLEAFSVYSVRVEAVNGAGSVSSPWVSIRTLEASPAGLANFSLEQREQGRALLLTWDTPHTPNGVITSYNIYSEGNLEFSGLSRQFLFRRLEPFSLYSLVLEACTSAGCTRTPPQSVTTAAAPPGAQPAPIPSAIGPHSVELTWSLPTHPNGPIGEYILLGRSLDDGRRGNNEETARAKVLFRESSTQASSFSHTVTGLRPWTQYQFSIRVHNPAGHTDSPWVTVTTRQAPPHGLTPPSVVHVEGNPYELLVSWTPPLESNGVLLSYRIQRDNVSFSFSFDPSVFNYTDEDLSAFTSYRYAITACTAEGCVTSPETQVKTLEAPPAAVDFPTITSITADNINVSWTVPLIQNGEVTQYMLEANGKEVYRGSGLSVVMSELRPHTLYHLVLLACTNGGCTPSTPIKAQTLEAPPRGLNPPSLKVTGPESLEITWGAPKLPNGIVTGYELRRDGQVIYVGMETRYHDFTLLPSVEYGYSVTANNSRGAVTSSVAKARTHPSAPSGVGPPTLQPLGPRQLRVDWEPPARPNGVIVSYTVYQRDPTLPSTHSFLYDPEHSAFSGRSIILKQLTPYHRYEVRVEACTELGCASSDWVSVLTLESPPTGQSIPLLELQRDTRGLQTVFLLSWPPPAQPNGRVLHYEVYRRLGQNTEVSGSAAALVYRNDSTTCRDAGLLPYTDYQYQVWVVNSVGRSGSQWANGRTGPAPPEGVGPPTFLRILATSAVVDIRPPTRPNGIVSLYRVFSQGPNATHTLLSEGTSRQQTLHGLSPYTQYWVGVEACTCYQCCSQGPMSELRTQASPPAQQPSPRPVALTSRSVQVEWDEPLAPNGLIESCEVHVRSSCPQPPQPVPPLCVEGPIETRFFGRGRNYNVTGLQPYSNYQLRATCYNNMGSTASNWTTVTTLTEAPQYISPFEVYSNLTLVWLDWSASFSLNGLLRDYSLTDNNLRVYIGFHSYLYIPRISEKTLSLQVTCTTDIGSASTPIIRYSPATGMSPVEPTPGGKQGVGTQGAPVYSEMWFILLLVFLGLLVLAVLLGLVLRRALRKEPFIRERPPLVPLQKRSQAGGDAYMFDTVTDCLEDSNVTLKSYTMNYEGLTDSKIVGGGSRFSPMSVLRVPSQSQLSHAYSQNSLHRSVSQLIEQDRKSLMGEGGQDSGLYVEDDEFVEAIKAFSSVRKEHTMFTDTHL